jgi:hypothetical protein
MSYYCHAGDAIGDLGILPSRLEIADTSSLIAAILGS